MSKKTKHLSRPIHATAILSAVCIIVLVLNACSTSFQQADTFQRSFNEHTEGWLNLIAILTLLGGWVITGITWLRRNFEFRTPDSSDDIKDKRPVFSFLTINGKSLFRQLTWREAKKSAKMIAEELLNVKSPKFYDPTLIVCLREVHPSQHFGWRHLRFHDFLPTRRTAYTGPRQNLQPHERRTGNEDHVSVPNPQGLLEKGTLGGRRVPYKENPENIH